MTRSTVAERARRRNRREPVLYTLREDFVASLAAQLEASTGIRFPSPRYARDPVGFFVDVLGVVPWRAQREVLEAIRDHDRVAWKSGRRVAKSHTVGGAALWWYASFEDARFIMTSTTARQVDQILWREVSMLRARAGRCVACREVDPNAIRIPKPCPHSAIIDGEIGLLARTGLRSVDFREVVGFSASQGEAVQGISGSRLFFAVDEASGVPDLIYEALEGNRAGGARMLLTGNPTKTRGEFFDAFHSKRRVPEDPASTGYHVITTSSEESPNASPTTREDLAREYERIAELRSSVPGARDRLREIAVEIRSGRRTIGGLATPDFVRERKREWGEDSALYRIHVLGEFATAEDGRIFSVDSIAEAESRWTEATSAGRLWIGLDPAGATGTGDETCFALRRGQRVEDLIAMRGLDARAHLEALLALIRERAIPREQPVVVLDSTGSVGAELSGVLSAHLERFEQGSAPFELVRVRASDKAGRRPHVYHTVRDELAASLEAAFRDGLAIPSDVRLAAELHELEWRQDDRGRLKLTPKDEIRKALGRSPDRYDALALACWEPLSLTATADEIPSSAQRVAAPSSRHDEDEDPLRAESIFDPYAAIDAFRGGR